MTPIADVRQYLSWQVITAFNVIIELALLAFPVWLVWGLQTDLKRKITVVAVFWLRLPYAFLLICWTMSHMLTLRSVIIAALVRIYYLGETIGSGEPLLKGVVPFVLLNVEMQYGLMAATMPTLKPFVGAFNTGWGTYDTTGQSGYGQNSQGSYALQSLEKKSQRSKKGSKNNSAVRSTDRDPPAFGKNITHIRSTPVKDSDSSRGHSNESSESQQMIIRQTLTTEVHYEQEEARRREEMNSSRGNDSVYYSHPKTQ